MAAIVKRGGRPAAPDETRAAVLALRKLDPRVWTQPVLAKAFSMSVGWVNKFLSTPEAVEALKAAEAVRADPVAEALKAAAAAGAPAPGSTDADIAELERAIRDQDAILATIKDPIAQANARTKLGEQRVKLARVRLAAKRDGAPAREASMLRAGHQAADRLRALLEEALGEDPDKGNAA